MSSTTSGEVYRRIRDGVLGDTRWRLIGPHRGGRVVAVAGDPAHPMTFYFGACAGGIWKTADGGRYWRNVSDGYLGTAAVGAIAVSPSDPRVVYAGTGEACVRNDVSHGDGVYRSINGGKTWTNVGLRDTRHIGKLAIHPRDPDTVYVAALGHAYGPNQERGVFRSRDAGRTWNRVLHRGPEAGCHDVSLDPRNPDTVFAAVWQVRRYPHTLVSGGGECGLWRSLDGGDTWTDISRRPGLPTGLLGKIGVAVSPAREGRVWAVVEAEDGAVFRSDDWGETWVRLSEESLLRTRPWYYMHITADPTDADTVYVQNYSLWKSTDAGATFFRVPTPHGDDHALWIDPADHDRMIEGNDGGACVSFNGGESWSSVYNQPTAQLYHVTTDNRVPYRVYGSQQDNTAISVPSMSVTGSIHERDWFAPGGGESGYIAIKPDTEDVVVASGPAGRRHYNDLMTTYDHRTGQAWNTTVWPELYGWGVGAGDLKYRFQWTFPIMFSRHDPDVLYVAGNLVFRSTDLGASWDPISPDLTGNDPTKLGASGGPITRDNTGAEVYCTVFALAESPLQAGLLWAGSDDGLVHVTVDGGGSWTDVTPPDLPEGALISIIEPSPHDAGRAYVAATRYKHDDRRPYLLGTDDLGKTWHPMTDGIPEEEFTRVIREDPVRAGLLYAGTETGLYASFDGGGRWHRLGGNLPVVPIYDLVIKGAEMVVATHGRSFWILDDLTPLRELADGVEAPGSEVHLFQPPSKPRLRVQPGFGRAPDRTGVVTYSRSGTSIVSREHRAGPDGTSISHLLDAGENPPAGVVVQYYLDRPPEGGVALGIYDGGGNLVRRFSSEAGDLPAAAGLNRLLWSTRLPGPIEIEAPDGDLDPWPRPEGPLTLPGTYEVRLEAAGQTMTRRFAIEPDPRLPVSREDLDAQHHLMLDIRDALSLTNRSVNEIAALLPQVRTWESRSAGGVAQEVNQAAGQLRAGLEEVRAKLVDVHMKESQLWPSGLHEKLNALFESVDSADHAPPRQAHEVFSKLSSELRECVERLRALEDNAIAALSEAAQRAELPPVGLPAAFSGKEGRVEAGSDPRSTTGARTDP